MTDIGDVMREAYRRGWITTRDGNISVKRNGTLYITPSGHKKYLIGPQDLIKLPFPAIKTGANSDAGASIELEMHWLIQTQRGVKAVVHLHPTYTIAAMHAGFNLMHLANQFVELSRRTTVGPMVPTLDPGSLDLATMTAEALRLADVVGQDRHGVTAKGSDPWSAFEHIERLEHVCQVVLASGVKP